MSLNADTQLLQQMPILASFDSEALRLLAFSCEKITLDSGNFLFRQGQKAQFAYAVLQGKVKLYKDPGLEERPETIVERGTLLGFYALLATSEASANAEALTVVEVLAISRPTFLRLLQEFPDATSAIKDEIQVHLVNFIKALNRLSPKFN